MKDQEKVDGHLDEYADKKQKRKEDNEKELVYTKHGWEFKENSKLDRMHSSCGGADSFAAMISDISSLEEDQFSSSEAYQVKDSENEDEADWFDGEAQFENDSNIIRANSKLKNSTFMTTISQKKRDLKRMEIAPTAKQ